MNVRPIAHVLLFFTAFFMLMQMFLRLPGLSGDASIYWTFARSMWEQGPYYFGTVGPKHGATSPLWAFLLSLVHLVRPHWYMGFQGLSIVLMGAAVVSTGLLARHITKSSIAGLVAANIVLLSVPLHRYCSAGYDTGLICLAVIEGVRASILLYEGPQTPRRWIHWLIPMAAMPLARPEAVMFFPLIALWTGFYVGIQKKLLKEFLIVGFISGLPSLFFYLWMYAETGHLVPTSVQGRDLVHSAADTFWPPVPFYALIYRNFGGLIAPDTLHSGAFAAVWMSMVGIGGLFMFKTRRHLALLIVAPATALCGMMLFRNPSAYMVRYSLPVMSLGVIFGTMGIFFVAQKVLTLDKPLRTGVGIGAVVVGLGLAFAPINVIYTRAHTHREIQIVDVLDVAGSKILNKFLKPTDLAIVYEIQTQYWLKCRTIAASGIVGGEIFPYLTTRNIREFKAMGVTHIFLSNAYDYRSIFDDTVMEHLWNVNDTIPINGEVEFQGVRLEKLVAREFQIMKPHWIAVYEVL